MAEEIEPKPEPREIAVPQVQTPEKPHNLGDSLAIFGVAMAVICWALVPTIIEKGIALIFAASLCIYLGYRSHWVKGLRKRIQHAIAIFCMVVILGGGGWQLYSQYEEEHKPKDHVWRSLSAAAILPPTANPYTTMFRVRNGASNTIIGNHSIVCSVIEIALQGGGGIKNINEKVQQFNDPLLPGGDAQSDPCIALVQGGQIRCADIGVTFNYVTQSEPARDQTKRFRFLGLANGVVFEWVEEPISHKGTYCE